MAELHRGQRELPAGEALSSFLPKLWPVLVVAAGLGSGAQNHVCDWRRDNEAAGLGHGCARSCPQAVCPRAAESLRLVILSGTCDGFCVPASHHPAIQAPEKAAPLEWAGTPSSLLNRAPPRAGISGPWWLSLAFSVPTGNQHVPSRATFLCVPFWTHSGLVTSHSTWDAHF